MSIWINLIYQLARRALSNAALWDLIEGYVKQASAGSGDGQAKRSWVAAQIAKLPDAQRVALGSAGGWLLNLAIEAMVAKIKVSKAA